MVIKAETITITSATRVKAAPSSPVGRKAVAFLKSESGIVRLYQDATSSDYVTFAHDDPLGPVDLEPGDELWVAANSTDVEVQVLQTGLT
tara:strand:- start:523 stop:792 length:270 start_codon:yes stop_codon:yes gene_type:complete